jgi:oligopeptide/dipeptide ABC transporter ATP-binding protein
MTSADIETGATVGPQSDPLLRVVGLEKSFSGRGRIALRAVDGVSFEVRAGECLAIVGESGSGKSTLARTLLRLVEPTGGSVFYRGRDLLKMSKRAMRAQRRQLQMIFQDPYASLHPRQTVAEIISEPWKVHPGIVDRADRPARIRELLEQVGLPVAYAGLYPSRLSGGERQRVAIARALALRPELLVLDEPVSALDVSIQAQVISVLMTLHRSFGLAYVFISHDLALVRLVSDRVAVMYMGRFVEVASAEELYAHPKHPYTQALLNSSPGLRDIGQLDLSEEEQRDAPSPYDVQTGCKYRTRCPIAQQICIDVDPALTAAGSNQHMAACHFAHDGASPLTGPTEMSSEEQKVHRSLPLKIHRKV